MRTVLLNVRLDPERARKVRRLRERGVVVSDLVRDAIDRRFDALTDARQPGDVDAIVASVLERYPDPPPVGPRSYDVHDRRQARAAILGRLRRPKRR